MRGQHHRRPRQQGDGREIDEGIVGDVREQVLVERDLGGRGHQEGVAVSSTFGDHLGADHAARAGLVLYHEALSERIAELLRQHARYRVRPAARGIGDHQADRPLRPILRGRSGGTNQQTDSDHEISQHGTPPYRDSQRRRTVPRTVSEGGSAAQVPPKAALLPVLDGPVIIEQIL
jgi:hypothetical protein